MENKLQPKQTKVIGVRCQAEFLMAVDTWREQQEALLSRPAAIRRLAELGLGIAPTGRRADRARTTTVRKLRSTGLTPDTIAEQLGVSRATVYRIIQA